MTPRSFTGRISSFLLDEEADDTIEESQTGTSGSLAVMHDEDPNERKNIPGHGGTLSPPDKRSTTSRIRTFMSTFIDSEEEDTAIDPSVNPPALQEIPDELSNTPPNQPGICPGHRRNRLS